MFFNDMLWIKKLRLPSYKIPVISLDYLKDIFFTQKKWIKELLLRIKEKDPLGVAGNFVRNGLLWIKSNFFWAYEKNKYATIGATGILLIGLIVGLVHVYYEQKIIEEPIKKSATHEKGGHGEETPPETFVLLELFSEALESSVGGLGVKIAELKPKVEHINAMYEQGEKHKAFAKALGIATEVIMLGFFIETFGIGHWFIDALSFQDDWILLMGQSMIGIILSTKAALFIGEKVEEAAEHRYEHDVEKEAAIVKQNSSEKNKNRPQH